MRPSDSPAASARLRSALGRALPVGQALFLCTSMFPSRGRPPVRLPPTARRRGSPVLRRPDPPTGRSGVSQVTGSSSSAVPQSTTPPVSPRLASNASGSAAFRDRDTLSTRDLRISGLHSCGPPARLATLQPCPHGKRLQAWLPACWLGFGWVGLAPTGRLIRVSVYILNLLSDRHCLVASTICRTFPANMPEYAGIYRHNHRPNRHMHRPKSGETGPAGFAGEAQVD